MQAPPLQAPPPPPPPTQGEGDAACLDAARIPTVLLALDDGDAACLDAAQVPIEVSSPDGVFETGLLDLHEVAII